MVQEYIRSVQTGLSTDLSTLKAETRSSIYFNN
jgi:hypothetical protein